MTQKAKEAAGMYSIGTIDLYQFLDACTSIEEAKEAMDAFEMEVLPLKVELNRACWRAYEINHAWTLYDRDALRNLRNLRLKRIADENPKYPSYEESRAQALPSSNILFSIKQPSRLYQPKIQQTLWLQTL